MRRPCGRIAILFGSFLRDCAFPPDSLRFFPQFHMPLEREE